MFDYRFQHFFVFFFGHNWSRTVGLTHEGGPASPLPPQRGVQTQLTFCSSAKTERKQNGLCSILPHVDVSGWPLAKAAQKSASVDLSHSRKHTRPVCVPPFTGQETVMCQHGAFFFFLFDCSLFCASCTTRGTAPLTFSNSSLLTAKKYCV